MQPCEYPRTASTNGHSFARIIDRFNIDDDVAKPAVQCRCDIDPRLNHLVRLACNIDHLVGDKLAGNWRTFPVVVIDVPHVILKLPPVARLNVVHPHLHGVVIGRIDRVIGLRGRIKHGHYAPLCVKILLGGTNLYRGGNRLAERLAEYVA